ncbi:hypothetical protein [Escherichia coli]|uniref:hypothetical protein n=1 Tax=Escherichia coli TaxID=562 RepID=UPI0039A61941
MKWEKAILRPSAMNIKCSVVCLHPWSENTGNIKPSGRYLSPENAVSALLPYLKENTEKDIVALLFCAPSWRVFITRQAIFRRISVAGGGTNVPHDLQPAFTGHQQNANPRQTGNITSGTDNAVDTDHSQHVAGGNHCTGSHSCRHITGNIVIITASVHECER